MKKEQNEGRNAENGAWRLCVTPGGTAGDAGAGL
jgi:hypothetical protein